VTGLVSAGEAIEIVVTREGNGARLDRFVAGAIGVSRAELQRWVARGRVTVDGDRREASTTLREGQRVVVLPEAPRSSFAVPDAEVTFRVLHVDAEVVVVDKPAGLVVHPARGHETGTLVNGLLGLGLFRREDLVDEDHAHDRPGIVHRLDKGTSGVMVVARTPTAREALKAQFQRHSIERVYEAIAVGDVPSCTFATLHGRHPGDRLRFTTRVAQGKRAVTHVRRLAPLRGATHVECTLETGRTHQIRVQLAEAGWPVLGDPVYGHAPRDPRVRDTGARLGHQALHARVLGFVHPGTAAPVRFEAPAPPDFAAALRELAVGSTSAGES
jgi:23S rRNA pseudouridine1911/1915/1917 synthase